MSLMRAMLTVGGLTMVSRVLGFARDIAVAAALGAGPIADAFFVAFKFPNFFRRLFGEGAFNSAFVPLFAGMTATQGRLIALGFAEQALAALVTALIAVQVLALAAMPWLMLVLAPGFADEPARFDVAVELTRITFPYLLFICITALMSGMLNSLDRFAAAAAAPILLNLAMLTAVAISPWLGLPTLAHGLVWGVFVAGLLQMVWLQQSLARAGMRLRLPRPHLSDDVKTLLRLMVPGALGAGITQVNLLVDVMLASLLPTGAVSYLYYADRVNQLPLGIVGAAIGTALLPVLSRQIRAGDLAAAINSQNRSTAYALILTVPAAVGLIILAEPIIDLLFRRGAFGVVEAEATAAALAAFAVGLPGYVLVKVFATAFFARQDTATPVRVAVAALVINVVLNLSLMGVIGHVGLALSTAIAGLFNAATLGWLLHRRGLFQADAPLRRTLLGLIGATLAMAAVLLGLSHLIGVPREWPALLRLAALAGEIGAGAAVFGLVAVRLGAIDLGEMRRVFQRRRKQ